MGEEASVAARFMRVRLVRASPAPQRSGTTDGSSVTTADERFMRRAFELAREPAFTSPNPRVGAVVVRDGEIIGEGFHQGAGTPHAEAVALDGVDAAGATLYVTLEPCIHHGRTPPCVAAIVEAGIKRVVAPLADPDEHVAGKGFAALTAAGVEVVVGTVAEAAETLNDAYLHHRRTGTSFVSLKLALSLDGALAARDRSARWITGAAARRIVHARRRAADAVLVGSGTLLADDPQLTVRDVEPTRQPLRIVVDGTGRVPRSARLLNDGIAPVLIATTERAPQETRRVWQDAGAEVLVLPDGFGGVDLPALFKELGTRDVVEVLCEGGAQLATSLLAQRLVDRLELHIGPALLGADAVRIGNLGVGTMADAERWRLMSVDQEAEDIVAVLRAREGA